MDNGEGAWRIDRAVRAARRRRGWTREALAFHSGLSGSAIAQIESGRRSSLRPASLMALATALDVSVDYLLGRVSAAGGSSPFKHRLLLYATPDEFVAGVLPLCVEGMERGDPILAVTTPRNGRALRHEFGKLGGRLRLVDSARWYQSLTGSLAAYRAYIDEKLEAGASVVRIIGEGWSGPGATELDSWSRYEALVNVALVGASAEIICAYNTVTTPEPVLESADETHPEALDQAGVAMTTPRYDPYDVILRSSGL
jgi:transcriptional regulator with XRE-family HTH domain